MEASEGSATRNEEKEQLPASDMDNISWRVEFVEPEQLVKMRDRNHVHAHAGIYTKAEAASSPQHRPGGPRMRDTIPLETGAQHGHPVAHGEGHRPSETSGHSPVGGPWPAVPSCKERKPTRDTGLWTQRPLRPEIPSPQGPDQGQTAGRRRSDGRGKARDEQLSGSLIPGMFSQRGTRALNPD